ncbi:general secretion pathway protein GspB [Pseudoalteromonas sp. JBTF-M23]|uniref:General secretion pathway protein GspB n=1 Tax=Pseudoalteromonas caenipelagi TaxID=2726988 RepID=A0A849VGI9_9GAMM|nr:general secretion pathway protein GspB [Pseudoalteromonas caenipelagi]NOU52396.1 general secretion pathway protein GspB [Pseudoalteromonas caenipelagi]
MSYLVNALKQSQQTAHSEQDHLAYQHEKQLRLYKTLVLGLSSVVLIGGFSFAGFMSGHYLQSSIAQSNTITQEHSEKQPAELADANKPQPNVDKDDALTAQAPSMPSQKHNVMTQPVTQPMNVMAGQPVATNNTMMSAVQYQWMSVQVGFDANGQALYRQQLVPVTNGQVMNMAPTMPQQAGQQNLQVQNYQQTAQEDLSQYRVLGKPLSTPTTEVSEPEDPALAGVSKELKEAFAQAVAETETQSPHHVTASSRDSARATPIELLPSALQNSLPSLRYQAHIYATDADKRWIKLNNRELYEGDSIGALQLVEITPEQALFNYDGYEFSMKAMQDWLP